MDGTWDALGELPLRYISMTEPERIKKSMPKIENKTVLAEFERVAKICKSKGTNLTAEAVANALVRVILTETDPEYLEEVHKEHRVVLAAVIRPFITASNNIQNSILAVTIGADGQPLMAKVKAVETAKSEEFA